MQKANFSNIGIENNLSFYYAQILDIPTSFGGISKHVCLHITINIEVRRRQTVPEQNSLRSHYLIRLSRIALSREGIDPRLVQKGNSAFFLSFVLFSFVTFIFSSTLCIRVRKMSLALNRVHE